MDDIEEIISTSSKIEDDEPEEEDELQAVAKHFGKEIGELTLEALIRLEQKSPEEEEENQEDGDVPKRKAPSLASILGTMPTAATLGLKESISDVIGEGKENGEWTGFITLNESRYLTLNQPDQSFSLFHHWFLRRDNLKKKKKQLCSFSPCIVFHICCLTLHLFVLWHIFFFCALMHHPFDPR